MMEKKYEAEAAAEKGDEWKRQLSYIVRIVSGQRPRTA